MLAQYRFLRTGEVVLGQAADPLEELRPPLVVEKSGLDPPRLIKQGKPQRTEIVPAAISGSWDVMRKGSLRIRPGTITVRFGNPIEVAGLGVADRDRLTERTWKALAAMQSSEVTLNEPA